MTANYIRAGNVCPHYMMQISAFSACFHHSCNGSEYTFGHIIIVQMLQ
jgi:hypothetical protein